MDDLDALLADLQNSVPGQRHRQRLLAEAAAAASNHQNNYGGTSGYGSLRTKPTSHSPVYQDHYATTETRGSPQSQNSTTTSHSYQYQNQQGSLPRSSHKNSYGGGRSYTPSRSLQPHQHNNSGQLSELDSLLQDLSNARYNNSFEHKKENASNSYNGKHYHSQPGSNYNSYNSYNSSTSMMMDERPTVDSLLNEMDNTHIYAVPNGLNSKGTRSPTPSRHVTITVRETTTEKLGPQHGSAGIHEDQIVNRKDAYTPINHYASTATRELDELMASLSDFKVSSGSHHHQTVTDYAKPNKGISHLTQTFTETSVIPDGRQKKEHLDFMLGSLQANMSRQGVNTVQKGFCSGCEKPIVGQVITALGKTWHPEHFTCNHCSQELGTRNFFERDGFPYCEPDYHNLFSPRCAYCNGAILDKCVTALDKTWHTEHFFCAQCGQQFGEDGFHERDGKPYCRNDYFEMFAPKCNGCNRAIMENYISALSSQWHPDCFVCRDCQQPFQGGSFFDHDGLPYCEMHYHAKRGTLCAGCSKPITGRCITAMFKKFHPEHFVCAFCLKQLNKGTFKEQNEKPYCHVCFDKIFG